MAPYVIVAITDEMPSDEIALRIATRLLLGLHPSQEPWESASTIVRLFGPDDTGRAFASLRDVHESVQIICEEWPRAVCDFRAYPPSSVDDR